MLRYVEVRAAQQRVALTRAGQPAAIVDAVERREAAGLEPGHGVDEAGCVAAGDLVRVLGCSAQHAGEALRAVLCAITPPTVALLSCA